MQKLLIFIIMAILFPTAEIFAHPHVRFTSKTICYFSGEQCEGCRLEWEFDDYFSGSMIHDFDKNHDGQFDENEKKDLYKNAFSNLKNYGYFVFLRKGSVRSNPERVDDFNAWHKDGKLFYSFYIPFNKLKCGDDFYIAVFDRSFYCSVEYGKPPVVIHQKNGDSPVYEITKNKKFPVYYNPQGSADDMTLYKKWKPGLETAYPDEIHIYYNR